MRNPCRRDCPKRRAGTKDRPSCHADCKEYATWKAEREAGKVTIDHCVCVNKRRSKEKRTYFRVEKQEGLK